MTKPSCPCIYYWLRMKSNDGIFIAAKVEPPGQDSYWLTVGNEAKFTQKDIELQAEILEETEYYKTTW
jgi:hypothetical protein